MTRAPIPQNGQAHSKNSRATADELFECLSILWGGHLQWADSIHEHISLTHFQSMFLFLYLLKITKVDVIRVYRNVTLAENNFSADSNYVNA